MPSLIITCRVADPERWIVSPERDALFAASGVTGLRTFVGTQDPTRVALLVEAPLPEAGEAAVDLRVVLAAMAEHPAVREVLAADGVIPGSLEFLFER